MFDETQTRMVRQALIILLVGMVAGIGLLASLIGGMELIPGQVISLPIPGDPGAWARAHVGGITNAMLIVIVALVLPGLGITGQKAGRIALMMVGTGWGFTIFYWAALFAPNRALTFGANRYGDANMAAWIGLAPALVFVIVSIIAVVSLLRATSRG